MGVPTMAVAAVPVVVLAMAQTVQAVAQAADALGRDPDDAAMRLRKGELAMAVILVAGAVATESRPTVVATVLAAAATFAVFDWLILK